MTILNINEAGKIIDLYYGIHKIKIIGSWLVFINNFKIYFKNIDTDERVYWKTKTLQVNDYVNYKKAKVVADVDILKSGKYSIHFENPSQLKVIYMGCFGLEIFLNRRIPNKNITIAIGT